MSAAASRSRPLAVPTVVRRTLFLLALFALACSDRHARFDDAGPAAADAGPAPPVDAGPGPPADAGPFDCRSITAGLADCLTLTEPDCASCHHDPATDAWALCPDGVAPPPAGPPPPVSLSECGVAP